MAADPPPVGVRRAVAATYAVFTGSGFAFASWASRIPQVRTRLHLDPAGLGLLLLAVALGSVVALPLAGAVVTRWGARRTVVTSSLLLAAALVVVGTGYLYGVPPTVAGLFLLGLANGTWDVAMNVHGARAEQRAGRALMPRFHAGFSVGTVAGAGLGAALVALGVPVTAHLTAVAVVVAAVVPAAARGFLPDEPVPGSAPRASALRAWGESRTVRIGVLVLAFAFAEGTANDWVAVALVDGYGVDAAVGALGFAVFLAAMTAGRWVGPALLDRWGRVPVVRALAGVAVTGLVVFVAAPSAPLAFVGAALWGAGTSLGFPVGMSAGADDPQRAAARVSVIASLGYCAFLAGPPLIGFLGQQVTVLRALSAVAVLLAVAVAVAGALAPPHRA